MPPPELATTRIGPVAPDALRAARRPLDAIAAAFAAFLAASLLVFGTPIVLVMPLVPLAVVAAARKPEIAAFVVLGLVGFQGTLSAHFGLSINLMSNLILAGLLIGITGKFIWGRHERSVWLWPGLLLPLAYVVMSLVQGVTSDSMGEAVGSFRNSTYFLVVALAIALAPWSKETYLRMARAAVLVAALVGVYGVIRYIIGPSGSEAALALRSWTAVGRPASIEPTFYGSFSFAATMAAYCALMAPYALILLLADRDRWRWLGGLALAVMMFGILASENRLSLVGVAVGTALVLGLFAISPAFTSARRIATTSLAVVALVFGGVAFYAITITDQRDQNRYEALIKDTGNDPTYFLRKRRWEYAAELAAKEPFGYGLGSQGNIGYSRPTGPVGPNALDSSYLKIAVEQGFPVMGLYALGLAGLLAGLALFVRRTTDRIPAALAIAAAGTLGVASILFYAGMHIEGIGAITIWVLIGIGLAMPATREWRSQGAWGRR